MTSSIPVSEEQRSPMATPAAFAEQRLGGRCAVVTGGGYGIGRAYVHRLAAEGAQVVVAEIDGTAAERVAGEVARVGGAAVGVRTDVGDEASVSEMVTQALAAFGKVDVLVNNAAVFTQVPLLQGAPEDIPLDHFERVLRVNVIGSWLCARGVIPDMRSRGYGKIINISSGTVFKGSAGTMLQYVTSKSALLGMTRSLARAVGGDGIRVNCVAPGATQTPETDAPEMNEALLSRARAERALARIEGPEDLVGTISFLASAESDFITGQTIVVDGGAFMH